MEVLYPPGVWQEASLTPLFPMNGSDGKLCNHIKQNRADESGLRIPQCLHLYCA